MGNVNMEASQINYRGGSKKMSVEEAIKAAGTEITPEEKEWIDTIPELVSQEIIAPEFDAEEGVYAVGDLVIYQGGLYKFTTAHETAGAWNAEEVAAVKVSDEIDSLKSGLIDLHLTKVHELVPVTTTVTSTEINSINGYSALLFIAQVNGTVRGTLYLPYSVVSSGVDMYIPVTVGNTQESVYIKYIDGTHISIQGTTATINYLMICGTK